MEEIERVELGSIRAYVTEDRAVYESEGWLRSKRQVLPASNITDVTVEERGSWILLALGILFGWQCAGGIVVLGFIDNPETWPIVVTIVTGILGAIFLTAFLLLKWVSVRVTAPDTSFQLSTRGTKSGNLRDFAEATEYVASSDKRRKTAKAAVTH